MGTRMFGLVLVLALLVCACKATTLEDVKGMLSSKAPDAGVPESEGDNESPQGGTKPEKNEGDDELCAPGERQCGSSGTCVPKNGCCTAADCTIAEEADEWTEEAVCAGGACVFSCSAGHRSCSVASGCIAADACCVAEDCGGGADHEVGTCENGACTYVCSEGFRRCGDTAGCVSEDGCCTDAECTAADDDEAGVCTDYSCIYQCRDNYRSCSAARACIPQEACCFDKDCSDAGDNQMGTCASGTCDYACSDGYRICPGSDTCIPVDGCCSDVDCTGAGDGEQGKCQANSCEYACRDGYRSCSAARACIPLDACCNDADCTAVGANQEGACDDRACVYSCQAGYRTCPGSEECISEGACCTDTECAGAAEGERGTCNASACEYQCRSGYHSCSGARGCIPDSACCQDADCKDAATNQVGTCRNNGCTYECRDGYRACPGSEECIPRDTCCVDADCTGAGEGERGACEAHACRYECRDGYRSCSDARGCIPENECCLDSDCDGSCVDGVCRPPEDCSNGVDDDGDETIDCADSDCGSFRCFAVPGGWQGPVVITEGRTVPSSCPTPYSVKQLSGDSGELSWQQASCAGCRCSGLSCSGQPKVSMYFEATCENSLGSFALSTDVCQTTVLGHRITSPPNTIGTCQVTAGGDIASRPDPEWDLETLGCGLLTNNAGGCGGTGVCAPQAPSGFDTNRLCVFRAGSHTCPSGFVAANSVYEGYEDSRACSQCSCVRQGACSTIVRYTGEECQSGAIESEGSVACFSSQAYKSFRWTPNPACMPSGGQPVGSVAGTGETTVCCR